MFNDQMKNSSIEMNVFLKKNTSQYLYLQPDSLAQLVRATDS